MKTPKHLLEFQGKTLLQHCIDPVSSVVDEIVVSAAPGSLPEFGSKRNAVVVQDQREGDGPLAGFAAALAVLQSDLAVVVTCDAPLLNAALLRLLFDSLEGNDIAIGSTGQPQFFPGVYRRCVGESAAKLLQKGVHRVGALLELHAVKMIDEADLRSVDPELNSYRDVDTPEEFEALVKSAGD
jgi:molybdopterin-guanine dinucleotide biosynthesis protein A